MPSAYSAHILLDEMQCAWFALPPPKKLKKELNNEGLAQRGPGQANSTPAKNLPADWLAQGLVGIQPACASFDDQWTHAMRKQHGTWHAEQQAGPTPASASHACLPKSGVPCDSPPGSQSGILPQSRLAKAMLSFFGNC